MILDGVLEANRATSLFDLLDASGTELLQYIIAAPVEKLYTFRVTQEVYEMISRILEPYFGLYVDREFRTLPFLADT